jgi:hypothetical protein
MRGGVQGDCEVRRRGRHFYQHSVLDINRVCTIECFPNTSSVFAPLPAILFTYHSFVFLQSVFVNATHVLVSHNRGGQ